MRGGMPLIASDLVGRTGVVEACARVLSGPPARRDPRSGILGENIAVRIITRKRVTRRQPTLTGIQPLTAETDRCCPERSLCSNVRQQQRRVLRTHPPLALAILGSGAFELPPKTMDVSAKLS